MDTLLLLGLAALPSFATWDAEWTTWRGAWTTEAEVVRQLDHTTDGAYAWWTARSFSDVDLSVRFRPSSAGGGVRAGGLCFRWQDNLNGYYVHFDAKNQQVILVKVTAAEPWTELDRHRGVAIAMDEWHTARVTATGERFAVWLDDALVAVGHDATFASGCVGLRAGQGEVEFTQFSVRGTPAAMEPFAVKTDPSDVSGLPRLAEREDHLASAGGGGYFPVLVTLDDGSLGAVVRGGAPHLGLAGRLDWIRSADGGRTWSPPRVLVDSAWDDRNPAVGVMPNGTVVCAYGEARSYTPDGKFDREAGPYVPKFCTSADRGETWSEAREIAPGVLTNGSPYGRIIVLPDGTALMPYYGWADDDGLEHGRACYLVRSTDGGHTWGDVTLVRDGYNEFSIERTADGRILAALRDWDGAVQMSESTDGGRSFGEPVRLTAKGLHPADLIRLDGDTILLVHGCRLEPKGVIARLSDDGGRTWPDALRCFVAWEAISTDCGYPSVQRMADGTLALVWYAVGTTDTPGQQCRCVRFTEAQLRSAAAAVGEE